MCTRVTRDGQQCAPRWTFEGATYEGCTANNSATAGVEWCVTSIHADWHEGWGECVPGCVETAPPSCPRIAQSGAACLARWEYRNVVYTGCTTRLGRAEWCVTDAQPPPQPTDAASAGGAGTAAELVWEYCRPLSAACRRGDLRPGDDPSTVVASPPPPPPVRRDTRSTLDRCQRVTTGGQRCYDSWRYKGAPEKQCTTTGSSSGREWCATDNRQHWDWCARGARGRAGHRTGARTCRQTDAEAHRRVPCVEWWQWGHADARAVSARLSAPGARALSFWPAAEGSEAAACARRPRARLPPTPPSVPLTHLCGCAASVPPARLPSVACSAGCSRAQVPRGLRDLRDGLPAREYDRRALPAHVAVPKRNLHRCARATQRSARRRLRERVHAQDAG